MSDSKDQIDKAGHYADASCPHGTLLKFSCPQCDRYVNGDPLKRKVATVDSDGGLRYDEGKVRLELIPVEWTLGLGWVLTKGAEKYPARNWELGMKWSKMIASILRHIAKFMCGEKYDKETGCHHMAHAAWNCLALMSYDIREIGENDFGRAAIAEVERVKSSPSA